jgi:hypothetical protein
LAAFLANVAGWLRVDSRAYQSLNLAGAGLACVASYLIEFWPFVVLEAVWALVAALALIRGRPATVS